MGNQEKDGKEQDNKGSKRIESGIAEAESLEIATESTKQLNAILTQNEQPEPYLSPVKANLKEEFQNKDLEKFTSNGVKDLPENQASKLRFISYFIGPEMDETSKESHDQTMIGACLLALPALLESLNNYLSGLKQLIREESPLMLKDLKKLYQDNFPIVRDVPLPHRITNPKFHNVMALFAQKFFAEPLEQLIGEVGHQKITELQNQLIAGEIGVPALCAEIENIILRNPDFQKSALLEMAWQYSSRELNNKVGLAETIIELSEPRDITIDPEHVEIKENHKKMIAGQISGIEKVIEDLTEFEKEIKEI